MGKTEILYEKIPAVRLDDLKIIQPAHPVGKHSKKKVRFENVYICSEWENGENG